MGLFIKRTETGTRTPLFTLGQQKTVLVVGLGNVGKEYNQTRHNVGFICIDSFALGNGFPAWIEKKDLKCLFTKQVVAGTNVILAKPTTFMNSSGEAVHAVQNFYKIANSQMLVVHDELDIPFGQIRTRVGGSSAGNNGIKSIIQHCGEDFARIRIGIANQHTETTESANFVLAKFNKDEQRSLDLLDREVNSLINEYLATGKLGHETRTFIM